MIKAWVRNERFWVTLACVFSFLAAALYSFCNTDTHHWAFILGTVKDAIRGDRFFLEIYIQYGVGQSLLFDFLNHFLAINYTALGLVTSIFYLGTLLLLFTGIKRFANLKAAILIGAIAFLLLHPYSIYPWPDYYAGFFVALGCWWMIARQSPLSGVFFFGAFLFRNTYVMGFLAASLAYATIAAINPRVRDRKVWIALVTNLGFITGYLFYLYLNNTLSIWYGQTIGAGSATYGMGSDRIFDLLKNAFVPARFWLPNQLVNSTFVVMNWTMMLIALIYLFRKESRFLFLSKVPAGAILFFALLALGGLSQVAMIYEVFRLQNATVSAYFAIAAIVASLNYNGKKARVGLAIYFVLMLAKLPSPSSMWPFYEGNLSEYSTIGIPAFGPHLVRNEVKSFYETLQRDLCDGKSDIINFTRDSIIGYLCEGQRNGLKLPFYWETMVANLDPENLKRVQAGDYHQNEVIVSGGPVFTHPEDKLVRLDTLKIPTEIRWVGGGVISVYRVERKEP